MVFKKIKEQKINKQRKIIENFMLSKQRENKEKKMFLISPPFVLTLVIFSLIVVQLVNIFLKTIISLWLFKTLTLKPPSQHY